MRGTSRAVTRRTADQLSDALRGLGCFVADVTPAGLLHAAGVRSLHARARIRSIDASRARAQRGVHLVLTAAELGALNQPTPLLIPHPELTHPRTPQPLAVDEVRYAGELVALVVADDRYLAEDAARLIDVDYEPLPAVVELEAAGAEGSSRVHADIPGNHAARVATRLRVQFVSLPGGSTSRLELEIASESPTTWPKAA